MRPNRLLFIVLLCCSFASFANTIVQIGSGGSIGSSPGPFFQGQTTTHYTTTMIYTQDELAAQGIYPGMHIHSLKWYKTGANYYINGASATATLYIRTVPIDYPDSGYGAEVVNLVSQIQNNFTQIATLSYHDNTNNIIEAGWIGFENFDHVYLGDDLELYVDYVVTPGTGSQVATDPFQWQYSSDMTFTFYGFRLHTGTVDNNSYLYPSWERPNVQIEFSGAACTVAPDAGNAISDAPGPICPGTSFGLDLTGYTYIFGQTTFTWESSSTSNGPWTTYSVALSQPLIGITASGSTEWYRAKVECGGLSSYSTPVEVVVANAGLTGNFTIDNTQPTLGSNFNTIAEAIFALQCGISGPLTFDMAAGGVYNEQLIIPEIAGTSSTNTITINGNGSVINYTANSLTERAGVKLNGADHIIINDLAVNVNGTTDRPYAYGIQLLQGAEHNTINNCDINVSTGGVMTDEYAGIVVNGAHSSITGAGTGNNHNNILSNNTITGGYYGIYAGGVDTANTIMNNKITGNIVNDFSDYGIYAENNSGLLIEGNNISRPVYNSDNNFTGIRLQGYNASTVINANKIHDPFMFNDDFQSAATAISTIDCAPAAGSENLVTNNLVYNFKGAGEHKGIYVAGSANIRYYHNTIALEHVKNMDCITCRAYGFYQNGNAVPGLEFRNNIISMNGTNTSKMRAVHFASEPGGIVDNNNYYFSDWVAGIAEIGYLDGNYYMALADWQNAIQGDANSVSIEPKYADTAVADFKPTNESLDNLGTGVAVTTDIAGLSRSTSTPDMGAYEFDIVITGVNTQAANNGLVIYPNPATNFINIVANEKVNASITTMDGKLLIQQENVSKLDVSSLPEGIYMLNITSKDGSLLKTEKIFKTSK